MATATERKFTNLRKRLDQLGYRQSLGIESLPLVDKLFGDLLHTTESLKNAKQQLGKHKEQKVIWDQHVEPFQADNARVIKENNQLHQQLMKMKEGCDQRARENKAILRRLEHENSDLKFLNTQYLQRLRQQEKESEKKTEKILELQDKNFQAVIQTPGGKKKTIPFRRQRMEIDCALPDSIRPDSTTLVVNLPTPDPYVADLLQVADQRISQLQGLVEELECTKVKLKDSIQIMKKQMDNREVEIQRLTLMLKGGRPAEALAADGFRQSKERMVAHLNIQVDFLQKAARELEQKLGKSEEEKVGLQAKVKELSTKNARMCNELEEIGELVRETQDERKQKEENLNAQIKKLEAEKGRVAASQEEVKEGLKLLASERGELLEDNQRMANLLADSVGDRKEVASLLERLADERKDFQRQCKQFRDKEATLERHIAELERMRIPPPPPNKTGPTEELRRVKRERDDLKDAVSSFETQLLDIQMDTKILAEDRDNFKLLYQQVSEELSRSKLRNRNSTSPSASVLRRVEAERDHVLLELQKKKTEVRSMQDRYKALQDTHQHDVKVLEDRLAEMSVQVDDFRADKEDASGRLESTKNVLASMEKELEESTQALSTANNDLIQQRAKVVQLQALIEASEKTRQDQQRTFKTQTSDMQASQATIAALNRKIAQLSCDLGQRDERVAELQNALSQLDHERDHVVAEVNMKDEALSQLQRDLRLKDAQVKEYLQKVGRLESQLGRAEGTQREKELQVSEVSDELGRTRIELVSAKELVDSLRAQVCQLRADLQTMTKENQSVHSELRSVSGERDSLAQKVREYAQTLLEFEDTITQKDQERLELVGSYESLKREAKELTITIKDLQGRIATHETELDAAIKEKQSADMVMKQQAREISSLRAYEEQLSQMTHSLSKMEGVLRQEQEEKKALIEDLETTRELCVQLDRNREDMSARLSSRDVEFDQTQVKLADLMTQNDLLKGQLDVEKRTSQQLHRVISVERQKEYDALSRGQEKEEEIAELHELLNKLESDRENLADQTRKLRADTVQQSKSLQRLQTDLATEKFEKEHMQKQLDAQRASLTLLTAAKLQANARSPSPLHVSHRTSPVVHFPVEPALSSPHSTQSLQQDDVLYHVRRPRSGSRAAVHIGDSSSSTSSPLLPSPRRTTPSPP